MQYYLLHYCMWLSQSLFWAVHHVLIHVNILQEFANLHSNHSHGQTTSMKYAFICIAAAVLQGRFWQRTLLTGLVEELQ